jgi:DNA-damage-inducible protein J
MTESTTFRIDKSIKTDAYAIFKQLGLKPSQAINLFLSQVAMRGGIPFELKSNVPNAETVTAFEETEHPEKLKPYTSFSELRKDIGA